MAGILGQAMRPHSQTPSLDPVSRPHCQVPLPDPLSGPFFVCFCFALCRAALQESIKAKGLRDDITVLVVDLLPSHLVLADKSACPVPKGLTAAKSLMARFKVSNWEAAVTILFMVLCTVHCALCTVHCTPAPRRASRRQSRVSLQCRTAHLPHSSPFFLFFLCPFPCAEASEKKEPEPEPEPKSAAGDRVPSSMNDQDSMHGSDIYERYKSASKRGQEGGAQRWATSALSAATRWIGTRAMSLCVQGTCCARSTSQPPPPPPPLST